MSAATTLVALAHAVLIIDSPGIWEGISGTATLFPLLISQVLQNSQLTKYSRFPRL